MACIYKIYKTDNPEFIYVGSTKNFNIRRAVHKHDCIYNTKSKLYNTIRENGGWENWNMEVIEEYDDISKTQLRQNEEQFRQQLNATLNSNKCYIAPVDYQQYHKDYSKKYRQEHKQYFKDYMKEYRKKNTEYFRQYRQNKKNPV